VHEVINPHDVLVCELEAALCLSPQFIQNGRIENDQFRDKLQRHISIQHFIVREPDNSHAAASERSDQRVAIKNVLPAGKISKRRIQPGTGSGVTHAANLPTGKMRIKNKSG